MSKRLLAIAASALLISLSSCGNHTYDKVSLCKLGFQELEAGDHQAAAGHFRRAVFLDRTYAGAHYGLGESLIRLEKWQDALASYDQAIRFDSEFALAYLGRSTALLHHREHGKAAADEKLAYEIEPRLQPRPKNGKIVMDVLGMDYSPWARRGGTE